MFLANDRDGYLPGLFEPLSGLIPFSDLNV